MKTIIAEKPINVKQKSIKMLKNQEETSFLKF